MNIPNPDFLFQLFYVLAFLVAFAILVYEGHRRKFPRFEWIIVLVTIQLFFIIGTKIFSISAEEWRFIFQSHTLLPNTHKSLLGGIVLGFAGYLFVRYLLKFRYPISDTFAIAFPAAVSIQTIGCFFLGCCFGKPSPLPLAVQYPVRTLPHYHQFRSGLLTINDLHSLPVHPVQLYLMVGGLLVICLVIRFRRSWKATGNLLLFSGILFILNSFVVEFFRDPRSYTTGGEMIWILKEVQWQYLILAILMTLVLIWREKTNRVSTAYYRNNPLRLGNQIVFLIVVVLILLILRNWFTYTEIIALNIALLPAVFFIGVSIYRSFASISYRWIIALSLFVPLFLMSQTILQTQIDTTNAKKINTYHTIGVGFATGNYTDKGPHFVINDPSGCGSTIKNNYFSQKYTAGGAGYSFTRETPDLKKIIKYGVTAFYGNYEQYDQTRSLQTRQNIFGINPFYKLDIEWIGIGGGLHLGNLIYTAGEVDQETIVPPEKNHIKTFIFPQFYLRVGPGKYLYLDFHLADQFPVSSPGLAYQAGFGSGLGQDNGTSIRTGFSFLDSNGYYLSAYIPIKNKLVLEPLFLWTGNSEKSNYSVNLPEKQFSMGISYRFGHK